MTLSLRKFVTFNPLTWLKQVRQMRRFVRTYRPGAASEGGRGHIAVIVAPWLGTAVPWFSIAGGLVLGSRGAKVTFVLDDLPFGRDRLQFRVVLHSIRAVLRTLPSQFSVRELGKQKERRLSEAEIALVERLTTLNTIWELRGETRAEGRAAYQEQARRQIRRAVSAIGPFFQGSHFDCVMVPGGVYGASGVWAACARDHGIRCATFDSGGPGLLTLSVDGIASQLHDIPRAFRLLKESSASGRALESVREVARAEMARRRSGTDRFASQVQGTVALDSRFDGGVLLALNCPWDSAALGLHRVFESTVQWVMETVRWVLTNTSSPVIVRQHPAERFESARSTDDYAELLRNEFANDPRLTFVAAADPINSYDLLERVSAVVVFTSTIGVEAAAKGNVVLTASSSYYSGLGFVWAASDLSTYQKSLIDSAGARCSVTEQMKDDALLCYYLTQCCNWVASPLSPEGYEDWIRLPFPELAAQSGVKLTFSAVGDNVPVCFLKHLENIETGLVAAR